MKILHRIGLSLISFILINSVVMAKTEDRVSLGFIYGVSDSVNLVKRTNGAINQVAPTCLNLDNAGNLVVTTDLTQEFVDEMHAMDIAVTPFLSNHWVRAKGRKAIENAENLTNQILEVVSQYDLDGINVDIENLTPEDRDGLSEFVRLLRSKLPEYKLLTVSVAANNKGSAEGWQGSYDYKALAENSNYLFVMTYDEHSQGGIEGPVASLSFVEDSILYALENVPKDKIVIGLPLYGRYWKIGEEVGGEAIVGGAIQNLAKNMDLPLEYDENIGQASISFSVASGDDEVKVNGKVLPSGDYKIWFDNEDVVNAKLDFVNKYDLLGVGVWALGHEKAGFWKGFKEKLNRIPREVEEPVEIEIKVDEKIQLYEAIRVVIVDVNEKINGEEKRIEGVLKKQIKLTKEKMEEIDAEAPHKHERLINQVDYSSIVESIDKKRFKTSLKKEVEKQVSNQGKHFTRLEKKY